MMLEKAQLANGLTSQLPSLSRHGPALGNAFWNSSRATSASGGGIKKPFRNAQTCSSVAPVASSLPFLMNDSHCLTLAMSAPNSGAGRDARRLP
jgi:hypothetical protein